MRKSKAIVAALVLAASFAAKAEATCGASAVCGDVMTSLVGEFITTFVRLTWSTDDESSAVGSYRILRYNCGTPDTCMTEVATIQRTGTCGTQENYSYDDYPPTPLSQWTYVVEVWKTDNTRACAVDVTPQ